MRFILELPIVPNARDRALAEHHRLCELRASLHRSQPYCVYCRKPLVRKKATLDHVLPVSRGGETTPDNLTISCRACNTCKGARLPEEWLQDLAVAVQTIGGAA